jgi:hypothetical protein
MLLASATNLPIHGIISLLQYWTSTKACNLRVTCCKPRAADKAQLHLLPAVLILLQARLCRRQSAAWQAALQ